jgi:formylglycine-generating enzyme required for sulfatase activity
LSAASSLNPPFSISPSPASVRWVWGCFVPSGRCSGFIGATTGFLLPKRSEEHEMVKPRKIYWLIGLLALVVTGNPPFSVRAANKTYTNSIGVEFVLIPAGSFFTREKGSKNVFDETERTAVAPTRKVTISKPFYLGKYEATQEQWYAVMGNNPAQFPGRGNPVERVSWDDTQAFINRLNQKEGHKRYRLPTEAEWEHAARAGTTTECFFGNDTSDLSRYAWYHDNSGETTHPVGQKQHNPWGLYDIYGNVWEWVQDWYGDYPKTSVTDPRGPSSGSHRVLRGVGWGSDAAGCCSAIRAGSSPGYRGGFLGFRLAFSPD